MWTIPVCMWKHTGKTHLHVLCNENQLGRGSNWGSWRLKRNSRIPKKIRERLETRNVFILRETVPGCGGAHLPCRPWGDRGRYSRTQSHPQLYWELKASLGYGRICLNPPYHSRMVSVFVVYREDSYFVEKFMWPKSRIWMFELLLLSGLFPGWNLVCHQGIPKAVCKEPHDCQLKDTFSWLLRYVCPTDKEATEVVWQQCNTKQLMNWMVIDELHLYGWMDEKGPFQAQGIYEGLSVTVNWYQ